MSKSSFVYALFIASFIQNGWGFTITKISDFDNAENKVQSEKEYDEYRKDVQVGKHWDSILTNLEAQKIEISDTEIKAEIDSHIKSYRSLVPADGERVGGGDSSGHTEDLENKITELYLKHVVPERKSDDSERNVKIDPKIHTDYEKAIKDRFPKEVYNYEQKHLGINKAPSVQYSNVKPEATIEFIDDNGKKHSIVIDFSNVELSVQRKKADGSSESVKLSPDQVLSAFKTFMESSTFNAELFFDLKSDYMRRLVNKDEALSTHLNASDVYLRKGGQAVENLLDALKNYAPNLSHKTALNENLRRIMQEVERLSSYVNTDGIEEDKKKLINEQIYHQLRRYEKAVKGKIESDYLQGFDSNINYSEKKQQVFGQ